MNLNNLPNDILYIIVDKMNDNILPVSIINKKFYTIANERLEREKKYVLQKKAFFVRLINPYVYLWDAFYKVQSVQECIFLHERYEKIFGNDQGFLKTAKFVYNNSYQIATETWHQYFDKLIKDELPPPMIISTLKV